MSLFLAVSLSEILSLVSYGKNSAICFFEVFVTINFTSSSGEYRYLDKNMELYPIFFFQEKSVWTIRLLFVNWWYLPK